MDCECVLKANGAYQLIKTKLTNFIEQSHSSLADSRSGVKKFPASIEPEGVLPCSQ
jgi:hypothetical protein